MKQCHGDQSRNDSPLPSIPGYQIESALGRGERALKWLRRNPKVASLSALVVLVALLGIAGVIWQWREAVSLERASSSASDTVAASEDVSVGKGAKKLASPRNKPPCPDYVSPRGYIAYRAANPIVIDGKLDDPAWQAAPWTDDFVDIEGEPGKEPRFRTRAKVLWDDRCLYIAAELEEPHVQGTFIRHDSYIFHEDNDFEVFLNPAGNNHHYAELEMNALNTTWDLRLKKPYRDGGLAEDHWEIPGLKTAVYVNGTINDPRDLDKGWDIEIAVPWEIVKALDGKPARPPRDGEQWRVNFSRVEWRFDVVQGKYVRRKDRAEDNWVWSPQGAIEMHRPEMWGYVQFSTAPPGRATFRPDPLGPARHLLHRIYYAQRDFYRRNQRYASDLGELGLATPKIDSMRVAPSITLVDHGYRARAEIRLPGGGPQVFQIREDSLVETLEVSRKLQSSVRKVE